MLHFVTDWTSNKVSEVVSRWALAARKYGSRDEFILKHVHKYLEETLRTSQSCSSVPWSEVQMKIPNENPTSAKSKACRNRRQRQPTNRQLARDHKTQENTVDKKPDEVRDDGLSLEGRSERAVQCYPMQFANDVKVTEEEASEKIVLGRLAVIFTSSVRLLPKSVERFYLFVEGEQLEHDVTPTYAQIVKTPISKPSWRRELNRHSGLLMSVMEKWARERRIFSIILKCEADRWEEFEDGDDSDPFSENEIVLLKLLKTKMTDIFGQTSVIDETILREDTTKYRLLYIVPTKSAVDRIMKGETKCDETIIQMRQENRNNDVSTDHEFQCCSNSEENSYISFEEKFWKKQLHYMKRKSGKANRKRLRAPITTSIPSKREFSLIERDPDPLDKHEKPLTDRKAQRQQRSVLHFSCTDLSDFKTAFPNEQEGQSEVHAPVTTKRMAIMQSRLRRLTKRLEQEDRRKGWQSCSPDYVV